MNEKRSNNFKDLKGQKFNRLLVLSLHHIGCDKWGNVKRTFWECLCDCGNTKIVGGDNLKSGEVKSCGCYKKEQIHKRCFIDMTGKRFGRLLVNKLDHISDGKPYWECLCDCGTIKIILGMKLRNKNTISCGCFRRENRFITFGEATFNQLLDQYVRGSKNRGIEFNLSRDEFKEIIKQKCFYCGSEPKQIIFSSCSNGDCIYNGIDRIDNSKGYIVSNVVSCCGHCNRGKNTDSVEDFLKWIKSVYDYSIAKIV